MPCRAGEMARDGDRRTGPRTPQIICPSRCEKLLRAES